jgi:hypothetical protein
MFIMDYETKFNINHSSLNKYEKIWNDVTRKNDGSPNFLCSCSFCMLQLCSIGNKIYELFYNIFLLFHKNKTRLMPKCINQDIINTQHTFWLQASGFYWASLINKTVLLFIIFIRRKRAEKYFMLTTIACKLEGARFHVILVYIRISINVISSFFAVFLVCYF